MLKIKENVDLKELEKFGFELLITDYREYYRKRLETSENLAFMIVKPVTRKIIIDSERDCIQEVDTLYDLIKADMVVKE